jgi:hypothetical protein
MPPDKEVHIAVLDPLHSRHEIHNYVHDNVYTRVTQTEAGLTDLDPQPEKFS